MLSKFKKIYYKYYLINIIFSTLAAGPAIAFGRHGSRARRRAAATAGGNGGGCQAA